MPQSERLVDLAVSDSLRTLLLSLASLKGLKPKAEAAKMRQKGEAAQRRRHWTVGRLSGAWPSAHGLLHPARNSGLGEENATPCPAGARDSNQDHSQEGLWNLARIHHKYHPQEKIAVYLEHQTCQSLQKTCR